MIKFKKLHSNAIIPIQSIVGFGLHADSYDDCHDGHKDTFDNYSLLPGDRVLVNTGMSVAICPGTVGMIKPLCMSVGMINSVNVMSCTIDSNHRGELQVMLINLCDKEVRLLKGIKIAQLIVTPVCTDFEIVTELDDTSNGEV